jgi:hypothetical protein
LDLKTGSYGVDLKITATVSWIVPQNQAGDKTDGRATAWDTHQDLAARFAWKQFGVVFPSLPSRLTETRWWVL